MEEHAIRDLEIGDSKPAAPAIERKLRWAAWLIAAGLLVQLASLTKIHPLAFVAFLVVGCPLVGAGCILYLVSLVVHAD